MAIFKTIATILEANFPPEQMIKHEAVADLYDHALTSGQELPMDAEDIAYLESLGFIVDLITGAVTKVNDADSTR